MSQEYYVENLSIETLAELTDEMIRFQKNARNKKTHLNLPKIIPAAIAAIVLFIGVMNVVPLLMNGSGSAAIPATITIKGVEYGTELTELDLESLQLTDADIEPLRYMVNLTELNLTGNQISDIGTLAALTNLTHLYLIDNQISDINPLSELTDLIQLDLWGNPIGDFGPLAGLTNLTFLGVANTQISDISVVAGLTDLTYLVLDNTQIGGIIPLELPCILNLYYFDANPLDDMDILAQLPNLHMVFVFEPLFGSLSPGQIEEIRETFKEKLPNVNIMTPQYMQNSICVGSARFQITK